MKRIFVLVFFICFSLTGEKLIAQEQRLEYWDDIPSFVTAQTHEVVQQLDRILKSYPPNSPASAEIRKMALLSWDGIVHDTRNDADTAVHRFLSERTRGVLRELELPVRSDSVYLHKLYNHGFIVRTKDIVLAFDPIHAYGKDQSELMSATDIERLADRCDVLLISHEHGDHADRQIVDAFLSAHKTVVIPPEIWKDITHERLLRLRSADGSTGEKIALSTTQEIQVLALPGHQGATTMNNVYHVRLPDGRSVMHTGDQANRKDLEWIKNFSQDADTDVLMVNCWMPDLQEFLLGVSPGLVISGHENEMGHSIDHREPFWLSYRRFSDSRFPVVFMLAGEQYRL